MIIPFVEQAIRPLEETPGLQAVVRALELRARQVQRRRRVRSRLPG